MIDLERLLTGDRVMVNTPTGEVPGVIDRVYPKVFWIKIVSQTYPLQGTMLVQVDRVSGKGRRGLAITQVL